MTATERKESKPELNRGKMAELRKSHWSTEPPRILGEAIMKRENTRPGSAAQFMTTHMQQFKWIQPKQNPYNPYV